MIKKWKELVKKKIKLKNNKQKDKDTLVIPMEPENDVFIHRLLNPEWTAEKTKKAAVKRKQLKNE